MLQMGADRLLGACVVPRGKGVQNFAVLIPGLRGVPLERTDQSMKPLDDQIAALDQIDQKAIARKLREHHMKGVILIEKGRAVACLCRRALLFVALTQPLELPCAQSAVLTDQPGGKRLKLDAYCVDVAHVLLGHVRNHQRLPLLPDDLLI